MKKLRSVLSVTLALVMACALFATMSLVPAAQVDAAGQTVPLSATRYRYPIMRYENPKFHTGEVVDKNSATNAYLTAEGGTWNGTGPENLVYARIENYDMFNMKVGKNKAFVVSSKDNTSPVADSNYMGYKHNFGAPVDTREEIFPKNIQGIPTNSTDHGIMFHIEVTGSPEHKEDGFCSLGYDEKTKKLNGKVTKHVPRWINITFQELDCKPDGTPRKVKGKLQQTAMNVKPDAKFTCIWTKKVDWENPDKNNPTPDWQNVEYDRQPNGKGIKEKDDAGNTKYKTHLKPDRHHKPGDVELVNMYSYSHDGKFNSSGAIELPPDFCGYVIIPFSEFQKCWDSPTWSDKDHMLNFKKFELLWLDISTYWFERGDLIFDELAFWGPTFAKVNGAYDYGNLTIENHRDCMNNRKRIVIKEEKPSEEPSKEAPTVIKKDVVLTSKENGITLEAPDSAKLSSKLAFHADKVKPDETDYSKQLYERLFGSDYTKFAAYNLYLGADGDQEPADFVQLNFPIPEGLDAAKCKVYTLVDGTQIEKAEVESKLSDDKKSISIKVNALGTYIIAEGDAAAEEAVSEEEQVSSGETAGTEASDANSESKPEAEKKANLTWLWIVLGVVAAAVIAVIVIFAVRANKAKNPEDAAEEKNDDKE